MFTIMKTFHNIIILFLISILFNCSSQHRLKYINHKDNSFYSIDSVFLITPHYEIGENNFTVGLELKKLIENGEYYFPNSEKLRVIIENKKGNKLLNTALDKSFFTAISPVEPQLVGEKQDYKYSFTSISLFDKLDEIELTLILPVKPNAIFYKKSIKLEYEK